MDERLKEAFHKVYEAEAKAALRLRIFAKKAEQEGLPQIAQLFRVIAFSEEIHGDTCLTAFVKRCRFQLAIVARSRTRHEGRPLEGGWDEQS